jgi:hypothetical protein
MKKNFTCCSLLFLLLFCGRLRAQTWQDIGADTTELNFYGQFNQGYSQLLVGPADQLYYLDQASVNSGYQVPITLQTFDGSHWVEQDPGLQSPIPFRAAIDPAGNIFLAAQTDTVVSVYKFNGSWSSLGTGSYGGGNVTGLAVTSGDVLYYAVGGYNGITPLVVFKSNGAGFTKLDTVGLGASTSVQNVQLSVDHQDSLYITYDQPPASGQLPQFYVKKFTGSGWRQIGTSLLSTAAIKGLAFDSHNVPYVTAATTNGGSTGYYLQLEKLLAGNWTAVGPVVPSMPDVTSTGLYYPYAFSGLVNVRIGVADTPYIAYFQPIESYDSFYIKADKFDGAAWRPLATNAVDRTNNYPVDLELSTDSAGHLFTKFLDNESPAHVEKLSTAPVEPTAFITFPNPFGIAGLYGQDFDPGAVSTNTDSADPLVYTIADTTIARIIDGKIHPVKTGNTTITANQPADSNFLAAIPVTVQLAIVPGLQQLAFPGIPEKKVGDSDFHAIATSGAGLPLVFQGSDSTIATVSTDGLIHIRGQGQIIISVYATGDSLYQQTQSLSQVLTIQPADSSTGGSGTDSTVTRGMNAFFNGGMLIVDVSDPQAQTARLQLFSTAGRIVYNQEVHLAAGLSQFEIPDAAWHQGIYYLRCAGSGLQMVQSIWVP